MRLGPMLRSAMLHDEKSLRGLGKEMGVDQATLHRFMSGKNPDGVTLGKVLTYLLATPAAQPQETKEDLK